MPIDLRAGDSAPIPCRHCGKSLILLTVSEGTHTLACRRCGARTEAKVERRPDGLAIKTSPVGAPPPA